MAVKCCDICCKLWDVEYSRRVSGRSEQKIAGVNSLFEVGFLRQQAKGQVFDKLSCAYALVERGDLEEGMAILVEASENAKKALENGLINERYYLAARMVIGIIEDFLNRKQDEKRKKALMFVERLENEGLFEQAEGARRLVEEVFA